MTLQFTVSISNIFDADSHEDAVRQMVEWLADVGARQGGYRSTLNDDIPSPGYPESMFIDAERLNP